MRGSCRKRRSQNRKIPSRTIRKEQENIGKSTHQVSMATVYEPREDSLLLQTAIRDFFITHPGVQVINALDMGTGSGILAAALCNYCRDVLAIDVNPEAVDATVIYAQSHHIQNLTVSVSDLFSSVKGSFDLIVFNPPYLPFDKEQDAPDIALSPALPSPKETVEDQEQSHLAKEDEGIGESENIRERIEGNELIIRFLKEAKQHLNAKGNILLLFSSLSKPEGIFKSMDQEGYAYEQLLTQKMFMEELFVYRVWVKAG